MNAATYSKINVEHSTLLCYAPSCGSNQNHRRSKNMSEVVNIKGQKFGRLEVLYRIENDKDGNAMWLCSCDCGKELPARGVCLRRGRVSSCGCLTRELKVKNATRHGMTETKEFRCWSQMKDRCLNPRHKYFSRYGGRGITICQRWIDSFEAFYEDMGPCPLGLTLEREKNNKGYCPENCVWATRKQQADNRRNTKRLTAFGLTMVERDWARKLGCSHGAIAWHLNKGETMEQIIIHFQDRIEAGAAW
jgi:hypothetical protein